MQKIIFVALALFFFGNIFGQSIEKNWEFSKGQDETGLSIININPKNDYLKLDNGSFELHLSAEDSVKSIGDYIFQNNLLVLFSNSPNETIKRFRVSQLTDSTMTLSEGNLNFNLKIPEAIPDKIPITVTESAQIIPSQGFSMQSLWRGILGMVSLIIIAFLFSSNRRAIHWKTVGIGLFFQLVIAVGVLQVEFIKDGFETVGQLFVNVLEYTRAGSEFLFGGMLDVNSFGFIFALQVLPTIIFFSALTSVLFYFGIIQVVVRGMGWLLSKLLHISGAESLSVAGNIFLGQTEAPLLIKAYLEKMNKSEILLVMIGGMATVAGAVLAAYIGFLGGDDPVLRLTFAKHLLAASVMAAPGAIVISKILYPQTEPINTEVKVSAEKIGSNFLDAIANGTTEGLKLAVNVGAMLLVFVAFIAMLNGILGWLGGITSINDWVAANSAYNSLSLEAILGTIFAPLMWLIGVAKEDMLMMGQLLGIKLVASEFVGYIQLADLKDVSNELHLNYEKSIIMATYMLCGFANFASIGIQIGGIGSLAPGQRKTLSQFGMKALIGGSLASLISATIAGMIIG